jgi:hypothetical protein
MTSMLVARLLRPSIALVSLIATVALALPLLAWAPPAGAAAPGISALYVSGRSGRQITFGWEGSIISHRARSMGWPDGYWRAEVEDIAVSMGRAYVAAGSRGLRIVNVGDPAQAAEAGSYEPAGESFLAHRVAVGGAYAYVADLYTVRVLDVSDPAGPVFVSQMYIDDPNGGIDDVEIAGHYAYVVGHVTSNSYPFERSYSLLIFDISDPARPVWKGSCGLSADSDRLTVRGRYAYVGGRYLSIVDIADPAAPCRLWTGWAGRSRRSSLSAGPAVDGKYAFVASDDRLAVFNVSRPAAFGFRGSLVASWPYSTGVGVALTDPGHRKRYALVAYDKAGDLNGFVQIADASRPLRLDHDHGELRDGGSGDINCVTVAGDWAYVGRGSDTRDNFVIAHLGPVAYSWVLDRRARTVPDRRADGPQSGLAATVTLKARGRGIWYFHVRGRDRGGHWGPTRTLKVRVK